MQFLGYTIIFITQTIQPLLPEDFHCLVCSGINLHLLFRKTGNRDDLAIYQCKDCRIVFLAAGDKGFNPELYNYYAERLGIGKNALYDSITEKRYGQLQKKFKSMLSGRRVLDVGCGQGHFVDFMMRSGWNVLGIDLSESAVEICRQYTLPVKKMDIFDSSLKAGSFDLLMVSEVIEHVHNPVQFIRRAEALLRPGGLLYLTTPNYASLDRYILGSDWSVFNREHLIYFTPRTLKRLFKTYTDFNIQSLHTQSLSWTTIKRFLPLKFLSSGIQATKQASNTAKLDDQRLREMIEDSVGLKLLKGGLNKVLDLYGCGSSISVLCSKPTKFR